MPINGFSVGRDITLDVITPAGLLPVGLITQFTSKPEITDEKVKGLDGITRHVRFPDGWSGSFELKRQDNQLDHYFAQLEDDYYAGMNEQPCTITETLVEPNGALSQYRYEGVLLKLDEAGDWEGDKTVKQKLSFVASRRRRIV
jgi:hypothetical protein